MVWSSVVRFLLRGSQPKLLMSMDDLTGCAHFAHRHLLHDLYAMCVLGVLFGYSTPRMLVVIDGAESGGPLGFGWTAGLGIANFEKVGTWTANLANLQMLEASAMSRVDRWSEREQQAKEMQRLAAEERRQAMTDLQMIRQIMADHA